MRPDGRYRAKPVVIEAMQYNGPDTFDAMKEEWGSLFTSVVAPYYDQQGKVAGLLVMTLEGQMRATPLDWIIKGTRGEFYPCKPDVFETKYEAV